MISAVPPRKIDPAYEKRGREGIRARGIRGDDACADDAVGGPAGPRIDDMTVAAPVDDDELLPGAARAKRGVPQLQTCDSPSGHERRDEVDPPAVAAAADGEEAAAAGGEQGVSDTRRTQAGAHAIESVALADRTQVQFSALAGEADGASIAVELDGVEPHQPACGHNRVSVW